MKTWINLIYDIDVVLDPEIHCIAAADEMGYEMEEAEGAIGASVTMTRKQRGWQALGEGQPIGLLIVESPTGLPEDAFVRARVRFNEAPSDLFAARQVMAGKCAPEDIRERILTWAKANAADGPFTDFLFSDADEDDIDAYLLGRPGTYYVDPATHEISINHLLDGDRVIDVSDGVSFKENPPQDSPVEDGGPVKKIVYLLDQSFTQTAKGLCNIGPRIGTIHTMNPDFVTICARDLPDGLLDFRQGAGWSVAANKSLVHLRGYITARMFSGRKVDKIYELRDSEGNVLPQQHRHRHHQMLRMFAGRCSIWALYMQYDLSQERQEKCYFELEVPVQSSVVTAEEAELVTLGLKDLFEDHSAEPWERDQAYEAGKKVMLGGKVYRAKRDVPPQSFFELLPNQPIRGYLSYMESQHPYWEEVPNGAALPRRWASSFLDTDRGRRVKEHVLCRMRKDAMRHLRGRMVKLKLRWEDAWEVTLRDEVRFMVPFGETQLAAAVGKVTGIKRSWPSQGNPAIELTVAVPFGDGTDAVAETGIDEFTTSDYFADDFMEAGDGIYGVAGDVAWTEEVDPIARDIDVGRLGDPWYSVEGLLISNQTDIQLNRAAAYGMSGRDPRLAIADFPTRLQVFMKPLVAEGVLIREYDVQATLLRGKRGIDLTTGGEP